MLHRLTPSDQKHVHCDTPVISTAIISASKSTGHAGCCWVLSATTKRRNSQKDLLATARLR